MSTDTALFEKFGNTIPPGEIIFKEGDEGEKLYIIQKGKVKITKTINKAEHVLAILEKGDFFGETALVTKSRRTATVMSITSVELLAFDRAGFSSIIEKNAKIALNMIDKLCRRLQNANLQIQHLVRKDSRGLVALNLLYRFKEETEDVPELLYKKVVDEISLNLEIPHEKIVEILSGFEKRKIIAISNDKLVLQNPGLLVKEGDRMM